MPLLHSLSPVLTANKWVGVTQAYSQPVFKIQRRLINIILQFDSCLSIPIFFSSLSQWYKNSLINILRAFCLSWSLFLFTCHDSDEILKVTLAAPEMFPQVLQPGHPGDVLVYRPLQWWFLEISSECCTVMPNRECVIYCFEDWNLSI